MQIEVDSKFIQFSVTCDGCPMVEKGFEGRVLKEYENSYLVDLDMDSVKATDKMALMKIREFNGRIVVAKKHVTAHKQDQQWA